LIERWREAYEQKCESEGEAVWLSGTLEIDPWLFLPAIANADLLDFAELVMGPFVQLDSLTINAFPSVDAAQAEGRVNAWHRDRYSEIPQTKDYMHPLGCNTIFYFQDLTDDFGPLRVVPGSHRRNLILNETDRHVPRRDELLLYPRAGDVVFTHCNVLHSGTPNISGKPRYFMAASYNRSFMKHRDPLDGRNTQMLLEEARERNDRRLMRLLGCDEQLWDRTNPYWFVGSDEERWRAWIAQDRAAMSGHPEDTPSLRGLVLKAQSRRVVFG
jgi:hypothetical protein